MKRLCKKILTGAFILLFVFIFKLNNVNAASCRIGVSAPASVNSGSTFKVTVVTSSSSTLGTFEYTLSYDSSKVSLTSGQLHVVDFSHVGQKSASYTYTFKSLTSGTASFKAVNASVLDFDGNECLSGSGSASVNMRTKEEVEASYSRNNYLKSLSVEGATLAPAFSKETLEYSVTLPPDTTKAVISATPEDSKSSVTGTGEVDVIDGLNKIEVTVTAEHGEKKTYVINLTVEELKPIVVKIKGKVYTVVRKKGQVENIPIGFSESKTKIKGEEVLAYKSDITKLTLVALKDQKGDVKLFIYEKGKYKEFSDAKGKDVNLLILSDKKAPLGYVKTKVEYNNKEIECYKLYKSNNDFYLVYAQDLETGEKTFYTFDKKNNTFQRFNGFEYNILKYLALITIVLVVLFILRIIFKIVKLFTPKEKKIKKLEKKLNKLKNNGFVKENDEYYDIESVDETPSIKKVEDDEYVVPKKSRKQRAIELKEAKEKLESKKTKYKRISLDED